MSKRGRRARHRATWQNARRRRAFRLEGALYQHKGTAGAERVTRATPFEHFAVQIERCAPASCAAISLMLSAKSQNPPTLRQAQPIRSWRRGDVKASEHCLRACN